MGTTGLLLLEFLFGSLARAPMISTTPLPPPRAEAPLNPVPTDTDAKIRQALELEELASGRSRRVHRQFTSNSFLGAGWGLVAGFAAASQGSKHEPMHLLGASAIGGGAGSLLGFLMSFPMTSDERREAARFRKKALELRSGPLSEIRLESTSAHGPGLALSASF